MAGGVYLAEVPEAAAEGSVAAVYADIRRVLGVPFVALVYRALATAPGRLERIWAELAPNLASEYAQRTAAELAEVSLAGVEPIPAAALAVTALDGRRAAATLAAFRRANSANILGLHALLAGVDAATPAEAPPGDEPGGEVFLPMATVETLPASVRRLLEEMSAPLSGAERPLLIPSLLRTFAHDPCLLALLWAALRPVVTGAQFRAEVARVAEQAAELAPGLPYLVTRLEDEAARLVVARFLRAIPAMLVTGWLLEAALAEILERADA